MLKLEQIALELLEYKLKDLSENREVRGGLASAWELQHFLDQEQMILSESEKARFTLASKELKRMGTAPGKVKSALDTFEALVLDNFSDAMLLPISNLAESFSEKSEELLSASFASFDDLEITDNYQNNYQNEKTIPLSSDPSHEKERVTLQMLANDVWWHDMEEVIQQLAVRCRVEKDRSMARLLYAISRNMQQAVQRPDFVHNFEKRLSPITVPITDYDDPLVSFGNLESLNQLVREVIEIIMNLGMQGTLYADLNIDRSHTLDYVKNLAFAIAQDPYMGQLSAHMPKTPNSQQLRIALQELAKEYMRENERKNQQLELENRLHICLEQERSMKAMLEQDIRRFKQAAQTFFERLEPYLPKHIGGKANDPSLPTGVLFSQNPALSLKQVETGSTAVTIHLLQPVRFMLLNHEIGISQLEHGFTLTVDHYEYPLIDRLKIDLGQHKLYAFLRNAYVHVKLEDESRSLAVGIAEAMAVLFVLSSASRDDLLNLVKLAANVSMGTAQALMEQAITKLRTLTARTPSRRKALEGFLQGAAKAQAIVLEDNLMMALVQRLLTAITVSPEDLSIVLESANHSQAFIHHLNDNPLSLTVGQQTITIRKYRTRAETPRESLVVMLPGRIVGSFSHSLIQPFPGGTLVCVRAADELAILFFENTTIRV